MYVAVVLFPGFQALDAFGPFEVFNNLSCEAPIMLCILAHSLEPVSTKINAPETTLFGSDCGQSVVPTHTFASPPKRIDVLLLPGGLGTRDPRYSGPVVGFLRSIFPSLRYLITVCTGSALAAQAGVLDGRKATSNKSAWQYVTGLSDRVEWMRRARWVIDGNVYTSSGISAGIDATFAFVEDIFGCDVASRIATKLEYVRNESWNDDPFC